MEIQGKTALITGAAKRVGREIALDLAQKGANIVLHYNHSKKEAEETSAEKEPSDWIGTSPNSCQQNALSGINSHQKGQKINLF